MSNFIANMSDEHASVVGSFEWLCDFTYLKPLFDQLIHERVSERVSEGVSEGVSERVPVRVLEVGCGTSTLAIDLHTAYPSLVTVHSIDNDKSCIQYMEQTYSATHSLTWMVYDMIECPDVPNKSTLLQSQSYDIIVDKGSLDAMLVEGCITPMLCEVYRLLKPTGVYFLCSLHPPELLEPLLTRSPLNLNVQFPMQPKDKDTIVSDVVSTVMAAGNRQKNIAICTKNIDCSSSVSVSVDATEMIATENEVMKDFFQNQNPFLTEEKKEELKQHYLARGSVPYTLKDAHMIISTGLCGESFDTPDCDLDYTYELFEEDLTDFDLANAETMTLEELIKFITIMQ
jgi:2-polyprenyl-3-methyl-5-hydroxy-6-metoxy-1,4-benzoquinol methylase